MPTLPFVVAPTIRTRTVSAIVDGQNCALEFPVYKALKGKEIIAIREHEYQSVIYRESSRLADALVTDGIKEIDAQRIAIRIISTRVGVPIALEASEQRTMLRHAPLIADISCVVQDAFDQQRLRTITALIAYRLPGCSQWTDDDSGDLPGPLQDAIFAFASEEQAGDKPQPSPDELVGRMVETLGKLAPGNPPPQPTGPASTGDAGSSGPTPPNLPPTDSGISRSNTSSKRSKKASAG